ncbi:hypothetical protein ACROYT_G034315 [Oculina patagonica]
MSLSNEAFNSSLDIMLNSNSTDNDTNLANTSIPADGGNPFEDFFKAAFGSAIFMFVVSFVTILANSLLLLILCIDPLKIFRNPTTYFLIGLAIVDLLTGLVQEPIYATCFMFMYLQHPLVRKCQPFMEFAGYFASCSITISLIIVFAFTVTQYIVVASPLKFGRLVTKKKVLISVVSIYLYTALFSCLPLMSVLGKIKDFVELFLHNYTLILITIVFYILLHYTMKRKMATVITITIRLFMEEKYAPSAITVVIANLMMDNLLYLKFLFDPFVYAWRMPKYRESLNKIVCRRSIERESSRNENQNLLAAGVSHDGELSTALNRSAITLLSFKNIEVSH